MKFDKEFFEQIFKMAVPNLNLEEDDLSEEEELFDESETEAQVSEKIHEMNSKSLCNIIVAHRYLGLYPEATVTAMRELGAREVAGDAFNYEDFIQTQLKELPALNFKAFDMGSLADVLKDLGKVK